MHRAGAEVVEAGLPERRSRYERAGGRYAVAYADERRWRTANSENPLVFRDTILALLDGERLTFRELVGDPA